MTQSLRENTEILPLPQIDGGFKTILADPPWRFANRTGKVAPEHRRLDRYSTLSFDEIKALPVDSITASDAHLYLWVPNALLPDGIAVMEAWGFRYVTNLVWAKRRKDGGPDGRGVGFYFRNVTELILFGVKGRMRTLDAGRRQVNMIETRKREHSRKPDEQYPLIESCSPGPYLEMFARYPQPGWSVWGDEAAADVAPRGIVHKGYAGGKLAPPEKELEIPAMAVSTSVAHAYESGKSIRDIADSTQLSIRKVRSILKDEGIQLRSRGRAPEA